MADTDNVCAIGSLGLLEHRCDEYGSHFKFTDSMLAALPRGSVSRQIDTTAWKVCRGFYNLSRRLEVAPPKQCAICNRQGNSAGKLSKLGLQHVFVRAQLSGCKTGDWICTRCSGDTVLRAQAKEMAALAGGVAGRVADAEAELQVRKISIVS